MWSLVKTSPTGGERMCRQSDPSGARMSNLITRLPPSVRLYTLYIHSHIVPSLLQYFWIFLSFHYGCCYQEHRCCRCFVRGSCKSISGDLVTGCNANKMFPTGRGGAIGGTCPICIQGKYNGDMTIFSRLNLTNCRRYFW